MKIGFKLNNIEIGEVKIGGVEVNTEFSINEMIAMRKESEHMLENMPTYLEQFANAMITVQDIEDHIENVDRERAIEEKAKEIAHKAKLNLIKNLFAQG
nr:MAG TPA: hypothetical protein [Caudoviricetes sp.]